MLLQFAVEIKFIEGPEVDLERCITIMLLGKQRSIEPEEEIVLEICASLFKGIDEQSAWELANAMWQMAQQARNKHRK